MQIQFIYIYLRRLGNPLIIIKEKQQGDFPGSPMAKTSPSKVRGAGSILGQGAKITLASGTKIQNIKTTEVTL